MLVNLDTKVTYLCLEFVERLKEEKLNANEKLVDGKLQTAFPILLKWFIIWFLFTTWGFTLGYQLKVYAPFVFFIFQILSNTHKAYSYQCLLVSMFWNI